jgi:acyl-CoA thioesterase-2
LIIDQIDRLRHSTHVTSVMGEELDGRISRSLDQLLAALDLRADGDDRFSLAPNPDGLPDRILGGQLLAQAVIGAGATASGLLVNSLHATFITAGSPGASVQVVVDRVRDGRSITIREVTILEAGVPLLVAVVSLGGAADPDGPDRSEADVDVDADGGVHAASEVAVRPEQVELLQTWSQAAPNGQHWSDRPPAVEMRLPEAPSFLTGATSTTARSHWMRVTRSVGDDPVLHAALLAYASDFFLMDMVFRMHPDDLGPGRANGFSLDHAIWFHRPCRFDRWHRHTQEPVALVGDRGLARGAIHDEHGRRVASVAQEVLLRPVRAR